MIVSDNGSVFTSKEFADFMNYNGITHVKLSPYHPSINGLAERAVQTFKAGIKRHTELSYFLFPYRSTPQTTTGQSPAELLLGRRLKSCLDLLHPNVKTKVVQSLQLQKLNHDKSTKYHTFDVNDKVFVNNSQGFPIWSEGIVTEIIGPLSFKIKLNDGSVICCHVDHILIRNLPPQQHISVEVDDSFMCPHHQSTSTFPNRTAETASQQPPVLRRSTCVRHPLNCFS